MRAIERKLRSILESKKNDRLSKNRISDIVKEFSEIKSETSSRPSIDRLTISLLRNASGPVTVENIVAEILKEYPEKDKDVLSSTTKRRLGGYLKKNFGENIVYRTNEKGVKFYTSLNVDKTDIEKSEEEKSEAIREEMRKDKGLIVIP